MCLCFNNKEWIRKTTTLLSGGKLTPKRTNFCSNLLTTNCEIFEVDLSPIQAIPTLDVSLQDDSEPSSSRKNVDIEENNRCRARKNEKGENSIGRNLAETLTEKYSLQERTALGQLCQRYKNQYEKQVTHMIGTKVTFNSKKRKHTGDKTQKKVGCHER